MPRPVIMDPEEFLKHEFKRAWNYVFMSYEGFIKTMREEMRQCGDCGGCYWKGSPRPCDCELGKRYNYKTINNINNLL